MKVLFTFFLLLFSWQSVLSQHIFNRAYSSDMSNRYGTYFGSVIATDSAYYFSGLTIDESPVVHNVGLYVKLDLNGNKVLQRTYGDTSKTTEMWDKGLISTQDGFLMKASMHRDGSIFLIKMKTNGSLTFVQSYYPSSLGSRLFSIGGLAPTHDKGWLLSAGETRGFHHVLILIKTDSNGVETDRWEYDEQPYDYQGSTILTEPDGGFIIGMLRTKGNREIDPSFKIQTHIFKIDSIGSVLWNFYTPENRRIACYYMTRASDGGLILYGSEGFQRINNGNINYQERGYILKLTAFRQHLWERKLGIVGDSYFNKIILKEGNLYAFGQNVSPDTTYFGAWIVKMDEVWGRVDYERVIGNDIVPSVPKLNYLIDAVATSDNGFLFCGYIEVLCRTGDSCHQWAWVVKLDSMGCEVPGCHTVGIEDDIVEKHPVRVFPNPAQDRISFSWDVSNQFQKLYVYDVFGKEIVQKGIKYSTLGLELELYRFQKGVYVYYLKGKNDLMVSGKFVKE